MQKGDAARQPLLNELWGRSLSNPFAI